MLCRNAGIGVKSLPLPNDATIADVMSRPIAPATEYARKIVEHMWDCRRQFGDPSVRIGVTGEGRAPNYRIEYTQDTEGRHSVFAVYNGLSHRPVEDLGEAVGLDLDVLFGDKEPDPDAPKNPDRVLRGEHWSTRVMRLDEVAAILGNL